MPSIHQLKKRKDIMSNSSIDLLHGSIFKSLSRLAIPIMATFMIQMAYNLVDMLWIGKLGASAVAAVGVAGNFMFLSNGLVNMPKAGAQALVGQKLGAQDLKKAAEYAKNAILITLLFGLAYGCIMVLCKEPLINFFNLTNPKVIQDATAYLVITCGLVVFSFYNQTMTGILTSAGYTKITFQATSTGLFLNLILDPLFIFGFGPIPALGVLGAALATVISQCCVTLIFLYCQRNIPLFQAIHWQTKPNLHQVKALLKIGFPISLQSMLFSSISICIARLVSGYGDASVAVQKVGTQIESISWMIADGFSASLSAFVAQNYGAKNYLRVSQGYHTGIKIVGIWGIITTIILIVGAAPIFQLFIHEPEILPYGVDYLVILGFSQLFMCLEIATQGAFNGLGKTIPPSIVSIVFTSARIPLAILLSSFLGVNGIWWAISISSMFKGVLLVLWYIHDSKKLIGVI